MGTVVARRPPVSWSGPAGVLLVSICWPLNWLVPGLRSHILFFPLWLGYILVVDAVVRRRRGRSLLSAEPRLFVLLFAVSAPAWWIFEALNLRLGNWIYLPRDQFSPVEYALWASLCFSTVIPAVFESADLVRSLRWVERLRRGPRIGDDARTRSLFLVAGVGMLSLLLAWPRYFFALTWLALVFLLEPIARHLDRRSLLRHWSVGDWRPAVSLALGALLCGLFWEMWNYWAWPKWTYRIPFVDFARVFEMPLLGYGGYLPFGLELYALTYLLLPRRFSRYSFLSKA